MKLARAAAVLLVLAALPAAAQEEPAAQLAPETDPAIVELRDKLAKDPDIIQFVAERVARSRLIGRLTTLSDNDGRIAAAKEWIKGDPAAAAHVALGLASDDASGNTNYEDALLTQLAKEYEHNPAAEKNLFGRLRKTAKDSSLLKKQSQDMSEDERREILRNMFEGQGSESNKVIKMNEDGKGTPPSDKPSTARFNGIYDRLSAGNLRGYSPQLMALQSALSARRPPGAPALVETGKLDYATLSYPAYGMNYDVGNLDKRLRAERILALAKLSGRTLTKADWADPDLETRLGGRESAEKLKPRLQKRAELAAKARAAMQAFLSAAEKAKDPNKISRALLVELGAKQKETARWIAAAALEEELSRVDELADFLTPELLAVVDAAPCPADERAAYRKRGESLKDKVGTLKANAEKALGLLESDGWASSLAEVDKLVAENRDIKLTLPRDIGDYSKVPYGVRDSLVTQPRWREWLDDFAVKWAPSLSYSKDVAYRRGRLSRYMNVYGLIASGDANAAHTAFTAVEPGSR
ncbi:MAG TPA: hypothetical protein VN915_14980 [Elusimicrobiota bacterium]|nr:hypothetical protein [Elusimicrobiota bacterium]